MGPLLYLIINGQKDFFGRIVSMIVGPANSNKLQVLDKYLLSNVDIIEGLFATSTLKKNLYKKIQRY